MRPLVERRVGRRDRIRTNDAAVLAGGSRVLDRQRQRLALDPKMLADTAASAVYRAVRLGDFAQARRLTLLAARTHPRNLRHWERLCALVAPRAANDTPFAVDPQMPTDKGLLKLPCRGHDISVRLSLRPLPHQVVEQLRDRTAIIKPSVPT
jgi:hypothetical protein